MITRVQKLAMIIDKDMFTIHPPGSDMEDSSILGTLVSNISSDGDITRQCHWSSGHYKCHVGGTRRELEYCGQFAEDLDYFLKDDIEYSHHGKVCASMCKNNDDQEKYCDEVRERWTYDSVGSIYHELF